MNHELCLRVFSPAEAEAMLPALTAAWLELRELRAAEAASREALTQLRSTILDQGEAPDAALALASLLEDVAARRMACHQKQQAIEASGPLLRDVETGTFDFPAIHAGQPVYLCWRVGEERIAHWHEVLGSFDGRQPL